MTEWINGIQNRIYTIVKTRTVKTIGDKFPNLYFTEDEEAQIKSSFPTVYIYFLPTYEYGRTLTGDSLNAFMCGVHVEVTTSKAQGQKVARTVASEVLEQFKKLGFSSNQMPRFVSSDDGTKHMVFRIRRVIAIDDQI